MREYAALHFGALEKHRTKVGFERVNQHVKEAMIQWIGVVVREKFQKLIDASDCQDVFSV